MGRLRDEHNQQELDDLRAVLRKCADLLIVLEPLMAQPAGLGPRTATISRYAPESKEPWSSEPANAYWAIHFGSRFLADDMRISLGLGAARWSSGENGLEVCAAVAVIVDAVTLRKAREAAERWRDQALQIRDIDLADRWVPVPRDPGEYPPMCPYCRTMSLRMSRARGEVRCMFPGCEDTGGNPTRGRMQYAPDTDGAVLIFGDELTLTFRRAA